MMHHFFTLKADQSLSHLGAQHTLPLQKHVPPIPVH